MTDQGLPSQPRGERLRGRGKKRALPDRTDHHDRWAVAPAAHACTRESARPASRNRSRIETRARESHSLARSSRTRREATPGTLHYSIENSARKQRSLEGRALGRSGFRSHLGGSESRVVFCGVAESTFRPSGEMSWTVRISGGTDRDVIAGGMDEPRRIPVSLARSISAMSFARSMSSAYAVRSTHSPTSVTVAKRPVLSSASAISRCGFEALLSIETQTAKTRPRRVRVKSPTKSDSQRQPHGQERARSFASPYPL